MTERLAGTRRNESRCSQTGGPRSVATETFGTRGGVWGGMTGRRGKRTISSGINGQKLRKRQFRLLAVFLMAVCICGGRKPCVRRTLRGVKRNFPVISRPRGGPGHTSGRPYGVVGSAMRHCWIGQAANCNPCSGDNLCTTRPVRERCQDVGNIQIGKTTGEVTEELDGHP